ncbi:MAG: hypothetical protein ACI9HH_002461, partial [Pseudomonadota bacterium]
MDSGTPVVWQWDRDHSTTVVLAKARTHYPNLNCCAMPGP